MIAPRNTGAGFADEDGASDEAPEGCSEELLDDKNRLDDASACGGDELAKMLDPDEATTEGLMRGEADEEGNGLEDGWTLEGENANELGDGPADGPAPDDDGMAALPDELGEADEPMETAGDGLLGTERLDAELGDDGAALGDGLDEPAATEDEALFPEPETLGELETAELAGKPEDKGEEDRGDAPGRPLEGPVADPDDESDAVADGELEAPDGPPGATDEAAGLEATDSDELGLLDDKERDESVGDGLLEAAELDDETAETVTEA
jgi:hypothetical protein